ncbi:hypothetical protein FRC00_003573 [Tulasnella sp. 408]|nr:hypothetical protein FRC00_003573 [Tulasnella sp. 408]
MTDFTTMLPPETWLVVLEFLAVPLPRHHMEATSQGDPIILRSSSGIRAMATMSRFFYQLADPFRFREVYFAVHHLKDPIEKLHRIKELLDLLDRRPEVKSWIRILSIGGEIPKIRIPGGKRDEFAAEYIIVERRIHDVIPELRGLSELRCRHMVFTPTLFPAILQLPQLDGLELEYFQVIRGLTDPTPDWMAEALVHLLRLETLVELSYLPPQIPILVGSASLVSTISNRIPEYVFKGLRKLNIVLNPTDTEVQGFVRFGTRCPSLVSLTIRWSNPRSRYLIGDQLRHRSLKQQPFPALQEFDGQLALASIFAQGRPVHSVECRSLRIRNDDEKGPIMISNIAALRPSVPLRVLRLTTAVWDEIYIETVAQHHTELEELVYEHWGREEMGWTARLEDALGKLAKLQRLALKRGGTFFAPNNLTHKLDEDHQVIIKLRSLCPNLQRAELGWLGIWTLSS